MQYRNRNNRRVLKRLPKNKKYKEFKFLARLLSFYAEYKANMAKKVLISCPLVNMRLTCNNKIIVWWFTIFRENENKTS